MTVLQGAVTMTLQICSSPIKDPTTAAVSVQMFCRVRDWNVISQVVTLLAGTEIRTRKANRKSGDTRLNFELNLFM